MDEAGWLAGRSAGNMIWTMFSRSAGGGRIKDERYRRFGIACTRRAIAALPGGTSPALDLLETSIGPGLKDALADVRKLHLTQMKTGAAEAPFGERARRFAAAAVLKCAKGKPTMAAMAYEHALAAVVAMRGHEEGWEPGGWPRKPKHAKTEDAECAIQAALVRDIFQNPFRPPVVLAPEWRTDTAVAIARQMFESGEFGGVPILADALQDAGCDNEYILNHCRSEHPHARGCWVVDLVLEKA
jgi:hypothetical protein